MCSEDAWSGPKCAGCSIYKQKHYAVGIGAEKADYFCVAESPHLSGPSGDLENHSTWSTDAEQVVKNAFMHHKETVAKETRNLQGRYTFSVRCGIDRPKKQILESCAPLFHQELLSHSKPGQPLFLFALGPAVLHSFGIKFGKYADIQGKFTETKLKDRRVLIFASLSKRQLFAKSGYFDILTQHITNFMRAVYSAKTLGKMDDESLALPLKALISGYKFPKTLEEVRNVVEHIVNYAPPGKDPNNHVIALDTETNTLYPHRIKLKILNLVVAWAPGKAAAIPIEHEDSPWSLEDVAPYIKILLECKKPKVFHNAKYDLRVLWAKGWRVERYLWDTMVGEHLLAEDKRGFYGLKSLTKTFLPKYAGYEDELQDYLRALEDKRKAAEKKQNKASVVATGTPVAKLKGASQKLAKDDGFAHIPLKALNEYGACDADVTRMLCTVQRERMVEENKQLAKVRKELGRSKFFRAAARPGINHPSPLTNIMFNRSVPATQALASMESYGFPVDSPYVDKLAVEMDAGIAKSHNKLLRMIVPKTLPNFNPSSPKQLQSLFFTYGYTHPETKKTVSYPQLLDDDSIRKTDGGDVSVDAGFLKMLKARFECAFAGELLNFRKLSKARNTFVENIRVLSNEDGRMHTTFHITGTSTGRLSSSDENMQNIPKRIGDFNIKRMFIPTDPATQVIVNADAKAAEVRLYAAYSGDKNLIGALNDGMDPHSFFASTVYNPAAALKGVPSDQRQLVMDTIGIDGNHAWNYEDFQNRELLEKTDPWYGKQLDNLRKNIKRVVFGILYGASKNKISAIVGIPDAQAQAIIDVLFRMFPTIPKYIENTKTQVTQLGIVETFLGRRRRFNLQGMTRFMRAKAERQAVNFKIQSTSSDIVLGVLCATDGPLRDLGGRLLITVHDSLVFELPKKYISQMPDFIYKYGVEQVAAEYPWLPVPFSWDVEVGPTYGDLKSVQEYLSNANTVIEDDSDDIEVRNEFETA